MRIAAAALALATAAATLTTTSAPAFAEESRAIVYYADLNLGTSAGRETLEGRFRAAARKVCGAVPSVQVREIQQVRECQTNAMAQAWNQVTATASSSQIRRTR